MLNLTELCGFGSGGDGPHKCWRLYDIHSSADSEIHTINVAELQLRAVSGGANQVVTVGGTSSGDSYYFNKYPSYAFDSNITTPWVADEYAIPQIRWLRFDFNLPVLVTELVITCGGTLYPYGPTTFDLQCSDDSGASWTTVKSFATTPGAWADGESRTFTI